MADQVLAHYQVLEKIGAGGMGEVYLARDTKLDRDVALKILPSEFSQDRVRLVRFQREAKLLAALSHPHIASIFGLEEDGGKQFLVMELAEGMDLSDRIAQGPIPMRDALNIGLQLASALEAAHEKGIIHRDLKPANIKISSEGQVKVLDFGLAKAFTGDSDPGTSSDPYDSPTMTTPLTQAGVILGTAAYMSPEQARGKRTDRRADIWAFGVILFEMLSGKQQFTGETVSDILASILRADPEWDDLPADTPPGVQRILKRCLEKNPKQRQRDIGDVRLDIEDVLAAPDLGRLTAESAVARRKSRLPRLAHILTTVLLGVAVVALGYMTLHLANRDDPVLRASIPPPEGLEFHLNTTNPGPPVLSPDGTMLVFSAVDTSGVVRLFLRPLAAGTAHLLSGTEEAQYPFWSPDSRWIGFIADGKLRKIAAAGGPPVTLCDAPDGKGGSWSQDGVIVFAHDSDSPISRVSAAGGEPTVVTAIAWERGETSHRHPRFLPNGHQFLYLARMTQETEGSAVMVGDLESGESQLILHSPAAAGYASGHLLFLREGTLMAQPFDPSALALSGEAFPVAENVLLIDAETAHAVFSAADNGMLVYQTGEQGFLQWLEWYDREGKSLGQLGERDRFRHAVISPNDKYVAASIRDPRSSSYDIWVYDGERGLRTRFTFDPASDRSPVWSPDSESLIFASNRGGPFALYRKSLAGTQEAELLYASSTNIAPGCWSADGKLFSFFSRNEEDDWDIWILPLEGDREPYLFLSSSASEVTPSFSPDGRWLTYASDESDEWDIYVTAFPKPGRKWQISPDHGVYPVWSQDGREIIFPDYSGRLNAVQVTTNGNNLEIGQAVPLCEGPIPEAGGRYYAVNSDAQRFLMIRQQTVIDPHLNLVVNWLQGIR